ncbi:GMC family oxidoreductase [Sphingomonas sp. OK281]|uniref:GMC family oxidoreductase n=1 Tax=Sphingomonas sp. OK281 TaxID=1881067 RepID=UPI0008E8ABDC|nr:GMC oxidoreductase [Sphingomonas sp. OK281]SFO43339.1 choline dehydrogenase [Sphingomonas sp. OK281]
MTEPHDIVIVGGGSAGCVLAARLSADPNRRVLLIEGGPGYPPDAYPADLTAGSFASIEPYRSWGFASVPGRTGHGITAHAGRVLGGGSAINGGISRRARPNDFERWVEHGLPDWSFEQVVGTFKSLENTEDGVDRWHGRSGPWPVRHSQPEELAAPIRAFLDATAQAGYALVRDFNDPEQAGGYGGEPKNLVDGYRQNTAMVYLTEAVRARPNLTIQCDATVDRIGFEGNRATTVRLIDGQSIWGKEIILSAGVYGSPAVLLRSGIGPAHHLDACGIEVVADLPVGEALRDQPMYVLHYVLKPDPGAGSDDGSGVLWIASSKAADGELDLQLSISVQPDLDADGAPIRALSVWATVVAPRSAGTVRLKSADPRVTPRIDYALLSDESDRRRLHELALIARDIMAREPIASLVVDDDLRGPGASPDELDIAIRIGLTTFLHGTSTVPMGGDDDPAAVVDGWGRVKGVRGLRVVDASIFPEAVSVPVNLTTIMVAERVAEAMLTQARAENA